MDRPTSDGYHGSYVTTPRAGEMMQLLGSGTTSGSVALTCDEYRAVQKLYRLAPEKPTARPAPPVPPTEADFKDRWAYNDAVRKHEEAVKRWQNWTDPLPFMQAGADRNAIRHAECDGLRMLAWIARFVQPGEDPLKALVQAAVDAGWDVDPEDVAWATDDSCDEEDES